MNRWVQASELATWVNRVGFEFADIVREVKDRIEFNSAPDTCVSVQGAEMVPVR